MSVPKLPEPPVRRILPNRAYNDRLNAYNKLKEIHGKLEELDGQIIGLQRKLTRPNPTDCRPRQPDKDGRRIAVCPYCLREFPIERMAFRALFREDARGNVLGFDREEDEAYRDYWAGMNLTVESLRPHILNMDPASGEVKTITFQTLQGVTDTVPYDAAARDRMNRDIVRCVADKYGLESALRICPYCHTGLPNDICYCDNYIYSMMGNTSCGKTVYLLRLILTMQGGRFMDGACFVSVNNNDMLAELAPDMFPSGGRPSLYEVAKKTFQQTGVAMSDATDIKYIPPVILSVRPRNASPYMVTLFDYPGEAISRDADDLGFFAGVADNVRRNSSGLIFLFDAGVTLRPHLAEEYQVGKEGDATDRSPSQVLADIYETSFDRNDVPANVPVAMVITKSDLIGAAQSALKGIWPGESPDFLNPASPHSRPDLCSMYRTDTDVRTFLQNQDPNVLTIADSITHGNCAWFAVSSTGIPLKYGMIPEGAGLGGTRECDPIEWLLYRNGLLSAVRSGDDDKDLLKKVGRWAAGFQVQDYGNLTQMEEEWRSSLLPEYKKALKDYTGT